MRFAVLLYAIALLLGVSFSANVSTCSNIASPGVYNQTANLVGAPINGSPLIDFTCIRIDASNVLYTCNGFNITDNGTSSSKNVAAIMLNGSNITVRGCRMSSYDYGIFAFSLTNSLVTNNTVLNTADLDSFFFSGSSSNIITNNIANNSNASGFILFNQSNNNVISNNTASSSINEGFLIDTASGNNLTGDTAISNGGNGFDAVRSSNLLFTNDLADSNGNAGFLLTNASLSTLSFSNASNANAGFLINSSSNDSLKGDQAFGTTNGFLLQGSASHNNLTNNAAFGSTANGFSINGSTLNLLQNNMAYNNSNGFMLDSAANNTLANNTAFSNSQVGVYLLDSAGSALSGEHYYNNIADFRAEKSVGFPLFAINLSGVQFDNPSGGFSNYTNLSLSDTVKGAYTVTWSPPPATLPGPSRPFQGKFINITIVSGPPSIDSITWKWLSSEVTSGSYNERQFQLWQFNGIPAPVPSILNTTTHTETVSGLSNFGLLGIIQYFGCPDTIVASGSYSLIGNVSGAPNDASEVLPSATACVKIAAPNVVFDCSGFQIQNNGTAGNTFGILLNASATNVTVRNCPSVSAYTYGAYLYQTANDRITNVTVSNNTNGFTFVASNLNVISNSKAIISSGRGFSLSSSSSNNITGSNATSSGQEGFFLGFGSNNNLLSNDLSSLGLSAPGFSIGGAGGGSSNNLLTNNIARDNSGPGFAFATTSDNNTIVNNAAFNNSLNGFLMQSVSGNNISANNATLNGQSGFLFQGSNSNQLISNLALNNSGDGIGMTGSTNNTVSGNNASQNGLSGFSIQNGSISNTLSGNGASQNGADGFFLTVADSNNLTGNSALSNKDSGIHLSSSSLTSLSGNIVFFNTNGITLEGSSSSNLSDNLAKGNLLVGILLNSSSDNNQLTGNNLTDGQDGIFVDSSTNDTLSENVALNNSDSGVHLLSSSANDIFTNLLSNNPGSGMLIDTSTNNIIVNNSFSGNGAEGIMLTNSDNNNLSSNGASGNIDGFSLNSSNSNSLSDNIGDGNTANGFSLVNSASNLLLNNNANDNSFGFGLLGSNSNNITNDTAWNNTQDGFSSASSPQNTFYSDSAYLNGGAGFSFASNSDLATVTSDQAFENAIGFEFAGSSGDVVLDDTSFNNSVAGFELSGSQNSDLSNDTSFTNPIGYAVQNGSQNNTFSDVNGSFNSAVGFLVVSSTSNVLSSSTICGTGGTGISLNSSFGTVIQDSVVCNNTLNGISLFDSNMSSISSIHLYNNSPDITVQSAPLSPFTLNISDTIFDNPVGNVSNYTTISMDDQVENGSSFSMNWSDQPSFLPSFKISFRGKYLNITKISGSPTLDTVIWKWLFSETSGFDVTRLQLWKFNTTWHMMSPLLNISGNNLKANSVDPSGVFAILQDTSNPDDTSLFMSIDIQSSCQGNIVSVNSGQPVPGADVTVNGESVGISNSSGQVSFSDCGRKVVIEASAPGYQTVNASKTLMDCNLCTFQCASDSDCPISMICSSTRKCVSVSCSCGAVKDHQCVPFQCCSNSDCTPGEMCIGNKCKVSECEVNGDCPANKYCNLDPATSTGTCKDITGCGGVSNHTLIPYECGDSPACPNCPTGFNCLSNKCVAATSSGSSSVTCPKQGVVGNNETCVATENDLPCTSCSIKITDPAGNQIRGTTDGLGKFQLPLDVLGTYQVDLLKNGTSVLKITVNAVANNNNNGNGLQTVTISDDPTLWGMLVFIVIGVVLVIYWRSTKGETTKRPEK